MVGPCMTAVSSNITRTDLKEHSFFSLQQTDMFCFLDNFPGRMQTLARYNV